MLTVEEQSVFYRQKYHHTVESLTKAHPSDLKGWVPLGEGLIDNGIFEEKN